MDVNAFVRQTAVCLSTKHCNVECRFQDFLYGIKPTVQNIAE